MPESFMDRMSEQFAPTMEFRILAALMGVAVVSLVWTAFREFQRDSALERTQNTTHDALSAQ